MNKTNKRRIITGTTLIIAFVVMMVSLSINTSKDDELATHISGIVTDENGSPLSNVKIVFGESAVTTTTDIKGEYSAILNSIIFSEGSTVQCRASDEKGLRWVQVQNILIKYDYSATKLDFELLNQTSFIIPAGPVILVSSFPGKTMSEGIVFFDCVGRLGIGGNPFTNQYNGNYSINYEFVSDNGILAVRGLTGEFEGVYYGVPGPSCYVNWGMEFHSNPENGKFLISNLTLDSDYVDPSVVRSQSAFYNVTKDNNITIRVSPKANVTLPDQISPKLNDALSESMTGVNTTCSYFYRYEGFGWDLEVDNTTFASVKLTALTPGTHQYQVYIEQNYIIHVWELP